MGSFDKKYIVRKAENILEECNENLDSKFEKNKMFELKKECKKLKRKNVFWKVCTAVISILLVMAVV